MNHAAQSFRVLLHTKWMPVCSAVLVEPSFPNQPVGEAQTLVDLQQSV
jgi:hypothetical protein